MQFVRCVILERPKGQYIDMMNSLKDIPLYVNTIVSWHLIKEDEEYWSKCFAKRIHHSVWWMPQYDWLNGDSHYVPVYALWFSCSLKLLNYFDFLSFDIELTYLKLLQKRVVCTKLDIVYYVFINND